MTTIKIKDLDLSLQTRVAISDEAVEEYSQLISDGTAFPPVTVYDTDGVLSLVDGFHRVAAMTRLGKEEVDANVITGTHAEALRAALSANDKHGLRRTNADKRHCLEMAWQNRDILFGNEMPTCRHFAEITGVSHNFSAEFLKEHPLSSDDKTPAAKYDAEETLGKWDAADLEKRATTAETKVTKEHYEERDKQIAALLKEGKDRFGVAIPEKLLAAFRSRETAVLQRDIRNIRKFLEGRIFGGNLAYAGLGQTILTHLDNALEQLRFWTPWCVCRGCQGAGCNRCQYHGMQTKAQYERNPEELKAKEK